MVGNDGIDRQKKLLTRLFGFYHHFFAVADFLFVEKRRANLVTLSFEECIRHTAADNKRIALFQKVGYNVQLIRDLCPAENCHEGTFGVFKRVSHNLKLFFDKEAANGGFNNAVFNDSGGGSVGAVRRAKRIVYVNFGVIRKLFAEAFVLFLFFPVEAQVFQKYRLAVL